jgi:CubicO group peptidase (beta-lactamase class C family)
MNFHTVRPEDEQISSLWIQNFLTRLECADVAMHGMILMRHGRIVAEAYYAPYTIDTPHRMFSITKSFVSLAIGLLEDEGCLKLTDHIVDYFPEKLPKEGVHPYIAAVTIRDMLMMATCHGSTTYKKLPPEDTDWVRSFFTVTPSHMPGTCFSYDTSSSHVLCALVEKLTGTDLLSYLRTKLLDEIGFSKDAYILKAPMGESMAGSGLVATPRDILKVMNLIRQNGQYEGKQLLPEKYLKDATDLQIHTYAKSQTFEEMQGYGYQIWQTTHDSFAFYGMAGQLAVYSPKKDMLLITTADTSGRNGGVQLIYDAYWQEIYDKADVCSCDCSLSADEFQRFLKTRQLKYVSGAATSALTNQIHGVVYELWDNPMGFRSVSLEFSDYNGIFTYEDTLGVHSMYFGICCNEISQFPVYGLKSAISGAWLDTHNFLIKAQIIDEAIGNLFILFTFQNDTVTLMMKKYEETLFCEFDGFASGKQR